MIARYGPLGALFEESYERDVKLTFARIERLIGGPLPASARRHKSFWANDVTHSHAKSWLSHGFEVTSFSFPEETVTFKRTQRALSMENSIGLTRLFGDLGWHSGLRVSFSDFKKRPNTAKMDQEGFEIMCGALDLADPERLFYSAFVHDPPHRGRRTRPGYGTIMVHEIGRPLNANLYLLFSGGVVHLLKQLSDESLVDIPSWPRQMIGMQYVLAWQQDPRFLVAWPKGNWDKRRELALQGTIRFWGRSGEKDYLRVVQWLLREADTFEDGLDKVLHRKQIITPARAVALAEKRLLRFVRPKPPMVKSLFRLGQSEISTLLGYDDAKLLKKIIEPMRLNF